MVSAMRSVFFTMLLLAMLTYIFGIMFAQMMYVFMFHLTHPRLTMLVLTHMLILLNMKQSQKDGCTNRS